MKLKNIAVKYSLFNKLLLILAFILLVQDAIGGTVTFSYTYSAKAIGEGKIYIDSEDVINPTTVQEIRDKQGNLSVTYLKTKPTSAKQDFFLTALPNVGFGLKQWRKVDENGTTLSILGATRKLKKTENLKTTAVDNKFYYCADFQETMVSVGSSDASKCQAFIDKEINEIGQTVTLTATTFGNYTIQWKKDGVVVSTDNPLVLEVTGKAHYVATAVDGTALENGYYRIKSAMPEYQNDYVRVADNWFDLTSIVGSASSVESDRPGRIQNAQNVLARDLKVSNDFLSDPSTVVYIKHQNGTQYNIFAQGIDVKELTTGTHHGDNSGDIPYSGCFVNVLQSGPVYELYAHINANSFDFGRFYFNDNNHIFTTVYADISANSKWFLEPVNIATIETSYFAASPNSSISLNGKFYTTLRLPYNFLIPLGSSLVAYSINNLPSSDGGLATAEKYIAGETIPAGVPVIIENTTTNPSDNKLVPTGDPTNYVSSNNPTINTALYKNYGTHKHDNHEDYTTVGDGVGYFSVKNPGSTTMYKLGVQNGKVGFWTAVGIGETIYGNSAYSTVPCALFEDVTTSIALDKDEAYVGEDILATITSVAEGATIQYSLDDGTTWIDYTSPFNLPNNVAGSFAIKAKATKGYSESVIASASYVFSTLKAPTISPANAEANVGETITFTATNPNGGSSSMQYRIDDGAWMATNGTITHTSDVVKNGTVEVKVIKGAAESTPATATYSFVSAYQSVSLAELVNQQPSDTKYSITDLTAVQVVPGLIICKDGNVDAPVADNGEIDYLNQSGFAKITEQSNWIALQLPEGNDNINDLRQRFNNKSLTNVKGELVNSNNPTFLLHELPEAGNATNVSLNTYVAASFGGTQESPVNDNTYFFVQPKPMELANIEWAQWDGTKFVTPVHDAEHPDWNQAELEGEFDFNGSYLSDQSDMTELKTGHIYEMTNALIEYKEDNFEKVYILGNINGNEFAPNVGMPMFTTDGKTYTAVVTVTNSGNGYGYFSFTRKLATQGGQAGWDEINNTNNYRFGANSSGNFVFNDGHLGQTLWLTTRNAGAESFQITPNTYKLVVHGTNVATLQDMSLVVTRESRAYAPLRDGESPKSYVVYPTSIIRTSSENNGVITGVMQLGAQREVAGVEYYNLAGIRSTQPWQGINIVVTRYTDGTTTTTKRIKR